MNKKNKKFQELSIEEKHSLINKALRNMIIKFMLVFIMLLISIIFINKISKLAVITSTGLFGKNASTGPQIYFTTIGIFLAFLVVCFIYMLILKKKDENKLDNIGKIYNTYDMLSFILTTIICFYFVIMFILTPCTVDGDSMNYTYNDEDRLIVWHLGYKPKGEDVVVIDVAPDHYNNRLSDIFILKRIVGVPGDIIEYRPKTISNGDLYINDILVEDSISFYQFKILCNNEDIKDYQFTIPSERYLVLGDNRKNSTDSRIIGLVYEEDIVGKVIFRIFPFNKVGLPEKNIK